MRYRSNLAYVDGVLPVGEVLQLCRLRYGDATFFGFAVYLASREQGRIRRQLPAQRLL